MRGSPLLRAIIVFAALLALAPLLWQVTRSSAGTSRVGQPAVKAGSSSRVELALTISPQAKRVSIQHLGREIWAKGEPAMEESAAVDLTWPEEGVELRVKVEWPEGAPTGAMRVRVVAPDGTGHDRSVWGRGSADEVLVFK